MISHKLLVLFVAVALTGCLHLDPNIRPLPDMGEIRADAPDINDVLQVQYLGTGGFFFRRGDQAILTTPLYTNPHWTRVGFGWIKPNIPLIDWLHPRLAGVKVQSILAGHAHYDHLLDVPYIARKFHPDATLYGSRSVINLLRASKPRLNNPLVLLDEQVARDGRTGAWIYAEDRSYRFLPIATEHGPHAPFVHLMQGAVKPNRKRLPHFAWGWKEGENLAFLIDFLDAAGNIDFRIYYEDSPTPPNVGLLPELPPHEQAPIDLAIVCVATSQFQAGYPETFVERYKPRHVILGHWEYFFKSPVKKANRLPMANLTKFTNLLEAASPDTKWLLPEPRSIYHYELK